MRQRTCQQRAALDARRNRLKTRRFAATGAAV